MEQPNMYLVNAEEKIKRLETECIDLRLENIKMKKFINDQHEERRFQLAKGILIAWHGCFGRWSDSNNTPEKRAANVIKETDALLAELDRTKETPNE